MNKSRKAAVLLVVGLAVGGCGNDSSAASEPTPLAEIDACALLTVEEIEEATGITPGEPKDVGPTNGPPMCDWPAQGSGYDTAASVLVAPSSNYSSYDEALALWRQSAEDMGMEFDAAGYEEVDEPGTVNAWLPDSGMLQAHSGYRMVQIYLPHVAPDHDRRQAAIALARHALGRLN